ncbi:COP23 domain-containing protein [Cylindrospermum sp. FACHB-282]|uniref:COP23 domain-containing protein n=1 Tax=Cylindrospermum sp. FACHB-282 TaxID=2692794 RepID=UPI0016870C6A|nr:COP23 domain-containing protein [Cylindrospermum sp. FACHB-282]MBD2384877.1 hypothetical protein [Cylindrospermum sp. FACHB-282]
MKLASLTNVLAAGAIALSSVTAIHQPSQAQGTTFFCGTSQGVPSTLANTPRGTVVVVKWVSKHFSRGGYNPQTRCEEVSARFQKHYTQGNLNFITAGYLNNQPAICAGNGGIPCTSEKLLFTLKPGQNAARTIQQLFNVRTSASGTLYESTNTSVVDMQEFLQEATVVNGETAPANPPAATDTPTTAPAPSGTSVW